MGKHNALVLAVSILGAAAPGRAGDDPYDVAADTRAGDPQGWGTAGLTAWTVSSLGFSPFNDGQWGHATTGWSLRVSGHQATCANVTLPSGAILTNVTTYTSDTDATGDVAYQLYSIDLATSSGTTAFSFTTAGTPGIQRVLRAVTPNVVINNNQRAYALCVFTGAVGSTNMHAGATFWYRLQVSPAPAAATFPQDVPTTHPFFRFVEALAASGVTGGCGPGAYCPDSPVTRGQLAVFLATALGLHFPN